MSDHIWRRDGVKVVRAGAAATAMLGSSGSGSGRATVFDFAGSGGRETWIGAVRLGPGGRTGAHHHGRHEVAVYVVSGRGEIRWGSQLEFAADVGPGDFVYFAPFVPHREVNLDADQPLDFVVVRSDNERIAVELDLAPAETPETVY
jgi:uncharacterized RmlC-like cupin family protein